MQSPKQGSKIEGSPLLNNPPAQKPSTAHSTINIEKLDKTRFTEMKEMDSENNSLRIIIYVLIVIAIGVGLALLVRQLISNQQNESATSEENPVSMPIVENNAALEVSKIGISDTLATNTAANDDYIDSTLVTSGSGDIDMDSASLDRVKYTDYQTFSRLIFDLSTTELKLPKVNLSYDSSKLSLSVEFVNLKNIDKNLMQDLNIGSLVSEIRFDKVNNKYIIFLSEKFKYRVFADSDNLVLDFKTLKELEKTTTADSENENTSEENPQTETDTDTNSGSNAGTKPAAPHYTNEFSQSQQYVSSKVTTNGIDFNNYYVWDEGSFFEFSWAEEGKLGDDYVPNATAYLTTEGNINYIMVEVNNLKNANLKDGLTTSQIESKSGITMAGANFAGLTRESFDASTGKAVYKIELKRKANFQLLTQKTYDEKTQILSIQIKD